MFMSKNSWATKIAKISNWSSHRLWELPHILGDTPTHQPAGVLNTGRVERGELLGEFHMKSAVFAGLWMVASFTYRLEQPWDQWFKVVIPRTYWTKHSKTEFIGKINALLQMIFPQTNPLNQVLMKKTDGTRGSWDSRKGKYADFEMNMNYESDMRNAET